MKFLLRNLYYAFGPKSRRILRKLFYFPSDLFNSIFNKTEYPPQGKIFTGPGNFARIGNLYVKSLAENCNLTSESQVLDIGCGIGRLAIPLSKILNSKGAYFGFDIVKDGIDWCKKNIGKKYTNFHFLHIDLKNDLYNLSTKNEAKNFVFPYSNNQFDVIVLTSVFTHMMPEDVENYIAEISRVLKNTGKCMATFFVLNDESKKLMQENNGFNFAYNYGSYALINPKVKEANIAFEEEYLMQLLLKNNLQLHKKIDGYWCGRKKLDEIYFQDTWVMGRSN